MASQPSSRGEKLCWEVKLLLAAWELQTFSSPLEGLLLAGPQAEAGVVLEQPFPGGFGWACSWCTDPPLLLVLPVLAASVQGAPKEVVNPSTGRASLLESIRQAGGIGKANLRSVKERKLEKKKQKEQEQGAEGLLQNWPSFFSAPGWEAVGGGGNVQARSTVNIRRGKALSLLTGRCRFQVFPIQPKLCELAKPHLPGRVLMFLMETRSVSGRVKKFHMCCVGPRGAGPSSGLGSWGQY